MPDLVEPIAVFDTEIPNVARMYDYMLGGKDNYAVDREAVAKLAEIAPATSARARHNRAFLGRAVRYVAGQGVTQFLDVGAGLPTQENVHQVARQVAPQARTVYVDNDPVVLSHARALLSTDQGTAVIAGDVRTPDAILRDPELRGLLDFSQPVCVMLVAIMHFVSDEGDPPGIVAAFLDAVVPGSYLVLSHATMDGAPPAEAARYGEGRAVYDQASSRLALRDADQVRRMLGGLRLIDPGLVPVCDWHPDRPCENGWDAFLCAVGRKD